MKADKIIKNVKIFTADKDKPEATALVVKDGKFVYVGDEAGLSEYEGEVTDLGGKFIMPGIIDSHVHVTMGAAFEYAELGEPIITREGKQNILDFISEHIHNNPGQKCYRFMLDKRLLDGAQLTKEELDEVCPDSELVVLEDEMHSCWINSKVLAKHGITDDTPDPIPGLSYYVRKDGHVTGNVLEGTAEMPIILDGSLELTDEQIDTVLKRWIDYSVSDGVLGYTINGAKQLGIENTKGSISASKDADFLVFDNDLLTAEHEGFSYNKPADVYFGGIKMN